MPGILPQNQKVTDAATTGLLQRGRRAFIPSCCFALRSPMQSSRVHSLPSAARRLGHAAPIPFVVLPAIVWWLPPANWLTLRLRLALAATTSCLLAVAGLAR